MQHTIGACKPIWLPMLRCYGTFAGYPSMMIGTASHDLARQFQVPQDPQGWRQDIRVLQPARCREERSEGHLETALFDEGPAGKSAALRRRPHGQEGRHR